VGQGAAILGLAGPELTADEAAFFREADPWGFILFARNVADPAQLLALTSDLRACLGRDVPVLVDQEGGRVQRLRAPHWREYSPPLEEAASGLRAMFLRSALIGAELAAVGIDVNCAPCADLAMPETHPFLHNRCAGATPDAVVPMARAIAEGLALAGVAPVLKHIPGHGRATADSHHDLPVVTADAATLRATDFDTFARLADMPMAMSAHVTYTAFDPDAPATLSPAMIHLIREEIGFDGLLMSDDISMQALSGSLAERTTRARAAGCDIVLHCSGVLDEAAEVVAAAGTLDGAAARRADAALAARPRAQTVDIRALEAEFQALQAG